MIELFIVLSTILLLSGLFCVPGGSIIPIVFAIYCMLIAVNSIERGEKKYKKNQRK